MIQLYAVGFLKLAEIHKDQRKKKQYCTNKRKLKLLAWANDINQGFLMTREVTFSDKIHLFAQGYKVNVIRRNNFENLSPKHAEQTVKHPLKHMFLSFS